MGSLFTKPKMPSVAAYVPAAATPITDGANQVPADASAVGPASSSGALPDGDAERAKGIIRKRLVQPQTIKTSYRGVLAASEWVPARKSLLGE